jgi:hypothetical protein
MPKSKVGVTLRIEVRDDKGRVVKVIETPSRSFTQNFATLLFASMWTEYSISDWKITYTVYDVMGSPIYIIGSTPSPPTGVNYLYDVDYLFYSEPQYIASPYQSYTIYMPGIWPGASSCPSPIYAYGPCDPISTSVLSPGLFSFPSSPVLTASGWQMTYSQTWTNVSSSPVMVSSVALVFGVSGHPTFPTPYFLYAAIVDNVIPPILISPNYSVTFTYYIYYVV